LVYTNIHSTRAWHPEPTLGNTTVIKEPLHWEWRRLQVVFLTFFLSSTGAGMGMHCDESFLISCRQPQRADGTYFTLYSRILEKAGFRVWGLAQKSIDM